MTVRRVPALRDAARADAAAIAELINVLAEEQFGARETPEDIVQWFDMPGLAALVAERDGEIVGYADLQRSDGSRKFWIDVREDPRRRGSAAVLLSELERRAAGAAVPDALLRAHISSAETAVATVLREAGYEIIRHSFAMEIALEAEPEPVVWPDGITVRRFRPGLDDEATYEAHMEAFADHWEFERDSYEDWRKWNMPTDFDPTLWFLAEDGDRIVGVCLCRLRGDDGWVGNLGVLPPWRRRGLGEALLRNSFLELYGRGLRKVGLGVDGESTTGAVRLYERVGMKVVRRSDTWERPL